MTNRYHISPITVSEIKSGIFSFHSKGKAEFEQKEKSIYEDEYFKVELSGHKLNQLHRDILDIIIYKGDNSFDGKLDGNYLVRTFSLYLIQKYLNYQTKNNNKWLVEKIRELQRTLIILTDKKKREIWSFSFIETFKFSEKRGSYAIVFHPLYYQFFSENISIDYGKLLNDILRLKYGITKACTRYLLTHKAGININVDKLLKKVGVSGTDRNIRKERNKFLSEIEDVKEKFNIEIAYPENRSKKSQTLIKYTRHPHVAIYHPQN